MESGVAGSIGGFKQARAWKKKEAIANDIPNPCVLEVC